MTKSLNAANQESEKKGEDDDQFKDDLDIILDDYKR